MKRFRNWLLEAVKGPRAGVLIASVWLVFLVFPVLSLLALEDRVRCFAGLLALVLFVPVYLAGFRDLGSQLDAAGRRWQLLRGGFVLAVMGVLCWAIGLDAISLLPFLVTFASYGLWPPVRLPAVVVLVGSGFLILTLMNEPDAGNSVNMLITALVAVLGLLTVKTIESGIVISEQGRQRAALEQRERMARDVHDLLGHSLTVANLQLQLAERLFDSDPERARTELVRTRVFLTEAQEELRHSVTDQRGRTIEEELDGVRDALFSGGLEVAVTGDPHEVTGPVGLVLGWVLREAVTNVLRHAHATRVEISFAPGRFSVVDDGDGYAGGEGNGLAGMRERVAAAGGEFRCGSSPLGGFEVVAMW